MHVRCTRQSASAACLDRCSYLLFRYPLHRCCNSADGDLGGEKAEGVQEGVWEGISQRAEGHDTVLVLGCVLGRVCFVSNHILRRDPLCSDLAL